MIFTTRVIHWYLVILSVKIKDIRTEILGWFVIILLFTSVQIKIIELRSIFRSDMCRLSWYDCSHWIFCLFDLTFLLLITIDVIWIMKTAKTKLLIAKWSWGVIKSDSDVIINEISETFSTTRFIIQVRKLHVWFCVHYFKYIFRWSSWTAVIRTLKGLDWEVILSDSNILIVAWFSS